VRAATGQRSVLFVASRPLVVLNMLEAREAYGWSGERCHLVLLGPTAESRDVAQMKRVAGLASWASLSTLVLRSPLRTKAKSGGSFFERAVRAAAVTDQLYRLGRVANCLDPEVLVAATGRPTRVLQTRCPRARTIVVDEGSSTITNTIRRSPNNHARWIDRVLGLNKLSWAMSERFSAYQSQAARTNTYAFFRRRAERSLSAGNHGLFLGMPWRRRFSSRARYVACVEAALAALGGSGEYLAHRDEEIESPTIGEWPVKRVDIPAELYAVESGILRIASFYSSGLLVAKAIFGDAATVVSFAVPELLADPRVSAVYDSLAAAGVDVRALEPTAP
jgi:hypothetical protein